MVICRDTHAERLEWVGPNNKKLGIRTRPSVQDKPYGRALFFDRAQKDDTGKYTCRRLKDGQTQAFTLVVSNNADAYSNDILQTTRYTFSSSADNSADRRKTGNDRRVYTNYYPHPTQDTFTKPSASNSGDKNELEFFDTPTVQNATEGARQTILRCEVSDGAERRWFVDGVVPEGPKFGDLGDGLVIHNITKEDALRNYTCAAVQTSSGDALERFITLRVLHKPRLLPHYEQEEIVYGYDGGFVDLICEVEAEPPPEFSWFVNNTEVKKYIGKIEQTPHKSILRLRVKYPKNSRSTVKKPRKFGEYRCNATNHLGTLIKRFDITEGTRPNPPTRFELAGENSEILNFYIEGPNVTEDEIERKMEPLKYRLEYRVSEEGKEENDRADWDYQEFNITEEEPKYSLQGLQHNTRYEVRAATINLAGLSEYTNSTFAKTLQSIGDSVAAHLSLSFHFLVSFSFAFSCLINSGIMA